jgi:hypothetical protein
VHWTTILVFVMANSSRKHSKPALHIENNRTRDSPMFLWIVSRIAWHIIGKIRLNWSETHTENPSDLYRDNSDTSGNEMGWVDTSNVHEQFRVILMAISTLFRKSISLNHCNSKPESKITVPNDVQQEKHDSQMTSINDSIRLYEKHS